MSAYLLLASETYSLPVLRPVAAAATRAGHRVAWLCSDAMAQWLAPDEPRISSRAALRAYRADATFATVHRVPAQLPGKQVQLFHGLNTDKRDADTGHFRIRGLFDLYCTHGPATTPRFAELAREHGDFAVAETGWPKVDTLFSPSPVADALRGDGGGRPVVMVASTFSASLTMAEALLPTLRDLVARGDRHWLLTLHPKSRPDLIEAWRALQGPHARFLDATAVPDMLRAADVLLCDTSSVTEEFALLEKPIVTLRTRVPRPFMVCVDAPGQVDAAIDLALTRPPERMAAMREAARALHPARDGASAERVIAATERLLAGGFGPLRRRRPSLWRRWQGRADMAALLPD